VQSVPITTKVVSLNPTHGGCELNAIFVSDLRQGMSVVFPAVLQLHPSTKLTVKVESGVKHITLTLSRSFPLVSVLFI